MSTTNVGLPEGPVSKAAERDKYIVSELKRLQGIVERQDTFINELFSRLSPVVLTESKNGSSPTDIPSLGVPLADDLAKVSRDLEKINEIFEDLLTRLEI